MILIAVAGVLAVGAAAVALAARQGGSGWWRFLLAGAAFWLAAQVVRGAAALPLSRGGPALAGRWWVLGLGALLAAVFEQLGQYVPLRWLRAERWGSALALGLGVGAMQALSLAGGLVAAAGTLGGPGPAAALSAVWGRFWTAAFHAGSAAVDGHAAASRHARWLLAAMGLQTAVGLSAAWYQHAAVAGGPAPRIGLPLAVADAALAALAALAWWLGRRLWSGPAGGAPPDAVAPAPPGPA